MMILHKYYFNEIFIFLEGFWTLLSDPFKPERVVRKVHLANMLLLVPLDEFKP